jgi:hypothetical protein
VCIDDRIGNHPGGPEHRWHTALLVHHRQLRGDIEVLLPGQVFRGIRQPRPVEHVLVVDDELVRDIAGIGEHPLRDTAILHEDLQRHQRSHTLGEGIETEAHRVRMIGQIHQDAGIMVALDVVFPDPVDDIRAHAGTALDDHLHRVGIVRVDPQVQVRIQLVEAFHLRVALGIRVGKPD